MDVGVYAMPGKLPGGHLTYEPQVPSPKLPNLEGIVGYGKNNNSLQGSMYTGDKDGVALPKLAHSSPSNKVRHDPKRKLPSKGGLPLSYSSSKNYQCLDDEKPKLFNPDPLPFQSSSFKASSIVKKVTTSKRNTDMWAGQDYGAGKSRGLMLSSDRFQWDGRGLDSSLSQRDRLAAEFEYMERMRGLKRKREMVPHREKIHFMMGGQKVEMCERFDIMTEINRLKHVALPTRAKDLYVGRGFKLPTNHALNRKHGDSANAIARTAPAMLERTQPCSRSRLLPQNTQPKLNHAKTTLALKTWQCEYDSESSVVAGSMGEAPPQGGRGSKVTPTINVSITSTLPPTEVKGHKPEQWPASQDLGGGLVAANKMTDKNTDYEDKEPPTEMTTPSGILEGCHVEDIIDDTEIETLRSVYESLPDPASLQWKELLKNIKTTLTSDLSELQEKYLQQVFNMATVSSHLGVYDFVSMAVICQRSCLISTEVVASYDHLSWNQLSSDLTTYTDLFHSEDKEMIGRISHNALREILSTARQKELPKECFCNIKQLLTTLGESELTKIDFINHIPYFLTMELT